MRVLTNERTTLGSRVGPGLVRRAEVGPKSPGVSNQESWSGAQESGSRLISGLERLSGKCRLEEAHRRSRFSSLTHPTERLGRRRMAGCSRLSRDFGSG